MVDINRLVFVCHNDVYLPLVSAVSLEYCDPIRRNKKSCRCEAFTIRQKREHIFINVHKIILIDLMVAKFYVGSNTEVFT